MSSNEIIYQKLELFLAYRKWRKANQETGKVICKIMRREKEGYLTDNNCKTFCFNELKIIDDLWVKHSKGRFGFSVQKQIWIELGGTPGVFNWDIYYKFSCIVGWDKHNAKAPLGHLPNWSFCPFCQILGKEKYKWDGVRFAEYDVWDDNNIIKMENADSNNGEADGLLAWGVWCEGCGLGG
jgi:hypothetical protein